MSGGKCADTLILYTAHTRVTLVALLGHRNCSNHSIWDMKFFLNHNLSSTCFLLLRIDVWIGAFPLWCFFLPLTYQHQWSILILLLFYFSDMRAMLILVPTKSMQGQVRIFLGICCEIVQIFIAKVVFHSVGISHNTRLDFVSWNVSRPFLCVCNQYL